MMTDLPPIDQHANHVTYAMIQHVAEVTKTPIIGLFLILQQEKGTVGECNKTQDCGPFQVNRMHYKSLLKFGLTEQMIVNTAIGNTFAAGIVLREKLNKCSLRSYDWFGQIACYHSLTPTYRLKYRQHLITHAQKLIPTAQVSSHAK